MRIQVTKNDIANGDAYGPRSCPIALATNRALKRVGRPGLGVKVGSRTLTIYCRKTGRTESIIHYENAYKKVRDWIIAFDEGLEVKPTRFDLEPSWISDWQ